MDETTQLGAGLEGTGGLLGSLPYQAGVVTRQISAENPSGAKGGACQRDPDPSDPDLPHSAAASHLGRGWKVRPFMDLRAGETKTLAEITGPGAITYIWLTSDVLKYSSLVLRCYWDGEADPSVEAPVGQFYAMGHDDAPHEVLSMPVSVGPSRGCGCYWPMPFRHHARITLENVGSQDARIIAYKVVYRLHDVSAGAAYFHARWNASIPPLDHPVHVILDGAEGPGIYVGTSIAWTARSGGWWGEGEVKFFIDGDDEFPTIADTGTEDYFGGAWAFGLDAPLLAPGQVAGERSFNAAFVGCPLAGVVTRDGLRRWSLYRWHLPDGIGFEHDLRVTVQSLGYRNDRYQPRDDEISSVAYWYQRHPCRPLIRPTGVRERASGRRFPGQPGSTAGASAGETRTWRSARLRRFIVGRQSGRHASSRCACGKRSRKAPTAIRASILASEFAKAEMHPVSERQVSGRRPADIELLGLFA
jgi:hypothetical protein